MTVYDFCDMCIDPSMCKITIYDARKEENIFMGTMEDAMESQYADLTVDSYDIPTMDAITVNVWFN